MQHENFVSLLQLRSQLGQIDDVAPTQADLRALEQELVDGWLAPDRAKAEAVRPLFESRPHWEQSSEIVDFLFAVVELNLESLLCDYESSEGYVGPALISCSLYTLENAQEDFVIELQSEEIEGENVIFPKV